MSNTAERDVLADVLALVDSTLKIPPDQVDIDANMESFGVNSLIVMELMENIEKKLDVTLTPAQFSNIDTLRGLVGLLEKLLEEKARGASPPVASGNLPTTIVTSGKAQRNGVSQQVLDYVGRKYAIDISSRSFDSIDDVVDALVLGHTGELLRHYGMSGAPDYATGSAKAPVIAIVGMSCRLPDAPDHRAFWQNLLSQKNSMREIPRSRWNWEDFYSETAAQGKTLSKWGALIDDVDCFDAGFFDIPAEEAKAIDPQLRLLLEETYRAVEDAGVDMKKLAGSRTGVFIGYEYTEYEHHLRKLNNQDFRKGPLFSSSSPSYYLSNRISHTFGLCGPSESFNVNCASSAVAINRAYLSLSSGESDLAIAGAASLNLFADDYVAASQYGVLSPNGTCGVFDDEGNGFTRGEGVAAIVLKRLQDAERDGDRIYGIVKSCHTNHRGAARYISEVKHESITSVLKECYEKASVDLETIHYVEVDGYATKWADSIEYEGIKGVFKNSKAGTKHVALGSVKGNIGNVESVSGVTNVMKIALSLHHKKFPATISKKKTSTFIDVDSASHPLYIADREIAFDDIRREAGAPVRAGINSFADSGTNVHILLEEYMSERPAAAGATQLKQLFVLSAKDSKRLENYVQRYIDFLSHSDISESLTDLVHTAQVGRESLNERLAIVASSRKELLDKLMLVARTGIKEKLGLDSKDVYYGKVSPSGKNPLASLITAEMAYMQLQQSMQIAQWKQVALLWVNGVSIPWEVIWRSQSVRRVSLPTYPFARDRHWVDIEVVETSPGQVVSTRVEQVAPAPEAAREESASPAAWYFYVPNDALRVQSDTEMSRVEKIELFLKQEIARQQKRPIDEIAVDKDFIELGMNSMGVAELIIKSDKLLHTNLSPSILFKYPEIGSLSEYLAEAYAGAIDELVVTNVEPSPEEIREAGAGIIPPAERREPTPLDILVALQKKGDKAPIFAVPGAGGNALSLQQLSHALGNEQPIYCLEPVGLDGHAAPMTTIEEIARFNIEALRSVQATGPYRLLGYSNGGIVAFEMTRKLLEQGESVSSLMMLDSLAPSLLNEDPVEVMMVAVFNRFLDSLGAVSDLSVEQLTQVPEQARSEYLYNHVVSLGLPLPKQQFMASFEVATASERACRAYLPAKLTARVDAILFRATDGFREMPVDYGWSAFLAGDLHTCDISADHFTLVENGPIAKVAQYLDQPPAKSSKRSSKGRAGVAA
jgi:3-oxoacyl-(acyl-carrier-protein) synthase/thioesterase domain-containing protein/acyl carrier protein